MACPRRRRGGGGPLALLPSPCGKCRGQDPACLLEEGLSEAISPTPPGRGVDGCLVRHLRMHVGSNTHPNLARPGRQSPSNLRLSGASPPVRLFQNPGLLTSSTQCFMASLFSYFSLPGFSLPSFLLPAVSHVCSPGP